jgi:hypothetical protein
VSPAGRAAGLVAVVVAVLLAASPVRADQLDGPGGGSTPSGYLASVQVRFSGDAAPGGGGVRTVRVAPACWWAPAPGPYTDAVAMLAWYDEVTTGGGSDHWLLGAFGPREIWAAAAEAERSGARDVSWYKATCRDPADYATFNGGAAEEFGGVPGDPATWVTYLYRPFTAGAPIPPPLVSPADLAAAARDVMVIPVPRTERNPKIRAGGAPTLVGLPTWFWVADPAAVGGANGTRTIRAEVGAVWAEVVARTAGLRLSSPAGGTLCPPARARTEYAAGVPEGQACTVAFSRASVGYPAGYPVTASTGWQATWTGSGGTGGTLDPLARVVTSQVPVAEVQNIVTR